MFLAKPPSAQRRADSAQFFLAYFARLARNLRLLRQRKPKLLEMMSSGDIKIRRTSRDASPIIQKVSLSLGSIHSTRIREHP